MTRVLVTGATGAFGAPLCNALAARGVEVDAMARNRPTAPLPDGVRFVQGDVCDPDAVDRAVAPVDQVVHLAWLVAVSRDPRVTERINIEGTRTVLAAMRRHTTSRLVFSSSVLAYGAEYRHPPYREDDELRPDPVLQYGDHKRIVEGEIAASGVPALVIRPAAVIGRHVTGTSALTFATPVLPGFRGEDHPWQFVHQDDVVRFLVDGVLGDRTGVVNLAADDTMSLERFGDLLGRRVARVPGALLKAGIGAMWRLRLADINPAAIETLRAFPVADTTRLREAWGFRCGWSSAEAVIDTRRAVAGVNLLGKVELRRRDAPRLPPVGGDRPADTGAPAVAMARTLLDGVLDAPHRGTPLVQDLAERAGGGALRLEPSGAVAATWAEREMAFVLGCTLGAPDRTEPQMTARVHQLSDAAVDALALASVAGPSDRPRLERVLGGLASAWAAAVDERAAALVDAGVVRDGAAAWERPLEDLLLPADVLAARR